MLVWIILFSILGSIGAISAAASFTLLNKRIQEILIPSLLSFSIGTLLTSAFLGLIPEAIHDAEHETNIVMIVILIAILFFFFLEKILIWRNCNDTECEIHGSEAAGPIVLIGDAFHNFTDGIVIASAFLTDPGIGIAISLAVLGHEIPQETGDFGILLHSGYSRRKAFLYNSISSSPTIFSGILSYYLLNLFNNVIPYMLAISAASFLYIALSDLTPQLHKKWTLKETLRQIVLILIGIIIMYFIIELVPHAH